MMLGDAPPVLPRSVLAGLPAPWKRDRVVHSDVDLSALMSGNRVQADALRMLELVPEAGPDRFWIGLTNVDLTLAPLAYLCGIAPLGGRRGLVSWARLVDGSSVDSPLVVERTVKEVAHELGHAAGLPHCRVHDCLMRASVRPDEMDLKGAAYCPTCADNLFELLAAT